MKRIVSEAEFSSEQLNIIAELASECGLSEQTVSILYGRGIDTKDKIKAFLSAGKENFLSPFLMKGMWEAKELLTLARDEDWTVVVYGDYDADGVCALTVMKKTLGEFGIDALTFVPERAQGYGLGIAAIDAIFEEYCPQLFITVDCGISNAAEVEYIKEQGAEVIVTDHHELPDILPDCIIINPKLRDDYPYDNLCGAGVAFKVGCALVGKEAYKYLDFVTIATIADSVPLTGENRDIVTEGLKLINTKPRKNYREFLGKNGDKITAQSLAFSIAPKINAAGRMGDAAAALKLFLSTDEREIYDYSCKLTLYNAERQHCCDELYNSAKQMLKAKGGLKRVIVLWDEKWNTGFVGIVAARLAEEYSRPALLFVKNENMLKGSARSVDGVNVFEALKACSHLIAEFGGHSQAAGVNVAEENLPALEEALDDYFNKNYDWSSFAPSCNVNGELSGNISPALVRELEMLEPCGVGNRKPQFVYSARACRVRPLKGGSSHVTVRCGGNEFMYFSGERAGKLLLSDVPKKLVFEYVLSYFKGKEQIRGRICDVVYGTDDLLRANSIAAFNALANYIAPETSRDLEFISSAEAQDLLKKDDGAIFIVGSPNSLERYDLCGRAVELFLPSSGDMSGVILVSPHKNCDLSIYERVVFLDDPKGVSFPSLKGKRIFVCKDFDGLSAIADTVSCQREALVGVFRTLAANLGTLTGYGIEEAALYFDFGVAPAQALFALSVFEDLGIIAISGGSIAVDRSKKTNLTDSRIYNKISELLSD